VEIIVKTNHPLVLLNLKNDVPIGAISKVPPVFSKRDISVPDILTAIVSISHDIDIGLFSAWLFEKTKIGKQHTTLYINKVEVTLERGEIVRVLSEQIKQTSQD
jgi:hypothetical protein